MTTLAGLLRSKVTGSRYTVDDYLGWVSSFTFNGVSYPFGAGPQTTYGPGDASEISDSFDQYVTGALQANPVVWACTLKRMQVFSQARFAYQRRNQGVYGELFGSRNLAVLERPWLHGTTADLLARAELDVTGAGNFYAVKAEGELVRLRPDWVRIILEKRTVPGGQIGWKRVGYAYRQGGYTGSPDDDVVLLLPSEVVHFAPYPDPKASFRGMSWMTPAIREVVNDKAATTHKLKFWENAATPNMMVRTDPQVITDLSKFREFVAAMDDAHKGAANAYKTLYLAGAADATVIGNDFKQMDLRALQGLSETRIAAAAGTHPAVVGLSEGMQGSSLNAGNYGQAKRQFADTTMHHMWSTAAASFEHIAPPPPGGEARLWFAASGIPFLREDEKDAAEIQSSEARAIRTLTDAGYTADSVVDAVRSGDWSRLVHSGLFSVQLQPPGTMDTTGDGSGDAVDTTGDGEPNVPVGAPSALGSKDEDDE